MSFLYTATLPDTKLDRRGRVAAYGYIKLDREGEKYLNGLAAKLKDANINSVFSSDTHAKAAEYVGRRMGLPVWTTRKLRGFNYGRFGGHSREEFASVLKDMLGKWDGNQTIPVVGGDSWTSYERRFLSEMVRIISAPNSVNVLVLIPAADHAVWSAFAQKTVGLPLRARLKFGDEFKDKVLKVRMSGSTSTTEPIEGRAERPADVGRSVPDASDNAGSTQAVDGIVRTADSPAVH